jgi:(1->4)-alpha-D-glucan 1-alpha-D-glucosylmutase
MIKAVREAKVHTEWLKPDEAYEEAFLSFIDEILRPSESNRFLGEFLPFVQKVAYHGMLNSLSQTLLKMFSPGVPDFYQGTELWDLNFVDPDNRRPVDFATRAKLLESLRREEGHASSSLTSRLLANWEDGRIKLYVICKGLNFRKRKRDLFFDGDYLPLHASGTAARHLCAFVRRKNSLWAIVGTPRLITQLTRDHPPLGANTWGSTVLSLPEKAPSHWVNVMTGEQVASLRDGRKRHIELSTIFKCFPLALLESI